MAVGSGKTIGVDESTPVGVIIAAVQVVQPGFYVLVIVAVAEEIGYTYGIAAMFSTLMNLPHALY